MSMSMDEAGDQGAGETASVQTNYPRPEKDLFQIGSRILSPKETDLLPMIFQAILGLAGLVIYIGNILRANSKEVFAAVVVLFLAGCLIVLTTVGEWSLRPAIPRPDLQSDPTYAKDEAEFDEDA